MTSLTLHQLRPETVYEFAVLARNRLGDGLFSEITTARTKGKFFNLTRCSNHHRVSDINKLESVQLSFTKRLVGFRHMTYDNRLKLLGLDRLELRRLRADLVTCYKIFNGLILIADVD